jgi:hypothetical protein
LKKSVKFGENWENSAKTHRRQRRNSETENTDKSADLADKSVGFSENQWAISGWFVPKTGRFLSKIGKWNKKTVKTTT